MTSPPTAAPPRPGTPRTLAQEVAGVGTVAALAVVAAVVAHAFTSSGRAILGATLGGDDPVGAARDAGALPTAVVVAATIALGAWLAHRAVRRADATFGLVDIADAARGGERRISTRPSAFRALGTWLVSTGMVSIGRESAILEAGGVLGSVAERRGRPRRGALVAAGVAAGFTAAYHAPLAAVLYVEEHLRVRRQARTLAYVVLAASVAHLTTRGAFDAHHLFAPHRGGPADVVVLALLAVVPATGGALLLRHVRERSAVAARDRLPAGARVAGLAAIAALVVALVPLTAGNGMDAIRLAGEQPALTTALALAVAKLVATAAALAAGAPGGAFSPTMATASGWTLLFLIGLDHAGVGLPADLWTGLLVAMAIGIAVGLEAPLTGIVVVPEMAGDLTLLPVTALAVLAAVALARLVERAGGRTAAAPEVQDEDA